MYTRESFLYKRLNELLRTKDEDNLINLLPYFLFLLLSFEYAKAKEDNIAGLAVVGLCYSYFFFFKKKKKYTALFY